MLGRRRGFGNGHIAEKSLVHNGLMEGNKFYFFEYDRPGKKTPGRTRWRMTIEHAAQMYPGYRPIMATEEVRQTHPAWDNFEPYAPGTGPKHMGRKG